MIPVRHTHALDDFQLIAVWMLGCVDPRAAIETGRFNHERVAFPMTDRRSAPCRIQVLRERAAVGWNHMVSIVLLPQHHQAILMMNIAVGKRRLV